MPRPALDSIPPFYQNYVMLTQETSVLDALSANTDAAVALLDSIEEEKWLHRYAEDKWSIKEMVQHIIDAERIFTYRALCIARGEKQSLPGFDENVYAAASAADRRTKSSLTSEFDIVRKGTSYLFDSFTTEQLSRVGIANGKPIGVNAIGFIIAGHVAHHLYVLQQRYLS
jgi:hypothetical protein